MAGQHLKVVLTGDGGDELFGGYQRYRLHRAFGALDVLPTGLLRAAARSARFLATPIGDRWRVRRRLSVAERFFGLDNDERYVALMTMLDASDRTRLLPDASDSTSSYLLQVLQDGPAETVDRLLRADLLTYLPEDLLVKMDRATMANSLEARAPLLDHHLVEFAARLPTERKIAGGTSKVLLREIAKQLLPAELVDRPKMGFTLPIGNWFKGALGERFQELVLVPDAASKDHIDPSVGRYSSTGTVSRAVRTIACGSY